MPKKSNSGFPEYRKHPTKNIGFVECIAIYPKRRGYFKGPYYSKQSRAEYNAFCVKFLALKIEETKDPSKRKKIDPNKTWLSRLLTDYLNWAEKRYKPGDVRSIRSLVALMTMSESAVRPVVEFDSLELLKLRDQMLAKDWSRTYINSMIGRVRQMFKWGIPRKLSTPAILAELQSVVGLKVNETPARETEPVESVAIEHVDAIMPYLCQCGQAMLTVQKLTGARGDEVCRLNAKEIDRSRDVWVFAPANHKTAHRKKRRLIFLGPRCQAAITPYLRDDGYFFTPQIVAEENRIIRRTKRKTKLYGKAKKCKIKIRKCTEQFTSHAYGAMLRRAMVKLANARTGKREQFRVNVKRRKLVDGKSPPQPDKPSAPPPFEQWLHDRGVTYFHAHQVRHSRSTWAEDEFGVEGNKAVTGNTVSAAQIYSRQSSRLAELIAKEFG